MTLKDLSQVALRGTARTELPKLPPSALADALGRLQATKPEAALLSRAALTGLHTRAGVALLVAESAPLETLPPSSSPLPAKLWPLLISLVDTSASLMTLDDIKARGWTLSAAQALSLLDKRVEARDLWPLLDERAQAVLDAHHMHGVWQLAEAAAQWQAQLDTLRQQRQQDPAAGASQTLTLWQEVKADKRRDLLDLIRAHPLPQDVGLLQGAEKDRAADVARQARLLQGHLSGPLQGELLALLPHALKKQGKSWRMLPFDLPEALGKVKPNTVQDSEHDRLLVALPFGLILQTLTIDAQELLSAAEKKSWHLGQTVRHLIEFSEKWGAVVAAPPAIKMAEQLGAWLLTLPQNDLAEQVTQCLYLLQDDPQTDWRSLALAALELMQRGTSAAALPSYIHHRALSIILSHCALLLDPATDISAPTPQPFVLPPAPTMPQAKRVAWEENLQAEHLERQADAEAAWRTLTETLRLRREWAQAIKETK